MRLQAFLVSSCVVLGLSLLACGDLPDSASTAASASVDSEERLRSILELPNAVPRAAALSEFLESIGPADLPAVERAIDPVNGLVDEVSGALILSWWAHFDPEAAYERSATLRGRGRTLWQRTVLDEWARRDPEAVLDVVQRFPKGDPERLLDATEALIRGWFQTDAAPEKLLPLIEPLPLGRTRNDAIDVFVNAMADARGVEATIAFVEALPEDGNANFKTQFHRRLATAIAHRDPQRAVAWAQRQSQGPHGRNLLRRVGARWGWVEGAPAMDWALGLPESESRAGIVRETYRGFRMRDREGADAWMREQTPTPVLEPAYGLYLIGVARDDPREALRLLDGVADEDLRDRLIVVVARSWLTAEPEAAESWLQGAGLPSELMDRIRGQKGPG